MPKLVWTLVSVVGLVAACVGGPSDPIPFEITRDAEDTLASWRTAGIRCGEPQVGMPGPAVDWQCDKRSGDVTVAIQLTADRHGVQSIIIGVANPTSRMTAARAIGEVVEVTSTLGPARSQIANWLRATEMADGVMPEPPAQVRRVSVDSRDPNQIALNVIPIGSSITAQPTPR